MRTANTLILLGLIIAVCACELDVRGQNQQSSANRMASADEAAAKAVAALPRLVNQQNFRSMGFESVGAASQANLGQAVSKKVVSYERLLKYEADTGLDQYFTDDEQVVYPVEVGGTVASAVVVTRAQANWRISSVGDAAIASVIQGEQANVGQMQIISVPGVGMEFVGVNEDNRLILIPVSDYPKLELRKGQRTPSEELVPRLAAYVKEFEEKHGEQIRQRRLVR